MGMSQHIVGIREPDAKFEQMKAVWESCTAAGVDPPNEVMAFFNDEKPDPNGLVEHLTNSAEYIQPWNDGDMCDGYEIVLADVPKNFTRIRFYTSY